DIAAGFTVFNSSPWPRTDLVRLEGEEAAAAARSCLREAAGRLPRTQRTKDGALVVLTEAMPSMGYASVRCGRVASTGVRAEAAKAEQPFRYTEGQIVTPFYVLA